MITPITTSMGIIMTMPTPTIIMVVTRTSGLTTMARGLRMPTHRG